MNSENELDQNQNKTYNLKCRKESAKKLMKQFLDSKEKDEKALDKIISLDNTLPDIYVYKLKNSVDAKLKERSYEIVDKESLKKFNVDKKINYRDLYFELIDYITSINLDEPENASDKYEKEDFLIEEQDDSYSESESIESEENNIHKNTDKNGGAIKVELKVDFEEKSDLDENVSDSEFKEVLEKMQKFDINNLLIKNEKINVAHIRIKFYKIYETYFSFINYKNNYPEFESELFYFHCLRYMLETYKKLLYKRFIKKILLTKSNMIIPLTEKIKNGEINDNSIKIFYYYIMNTQYYVDDKYLLPLKKNFIFAEFNDYIIKNNNLYKKNNQNEILLEHADEYLIDEIINNNLVFSKDKINDLKRFYSIKGLLKNLTFKKEEGDKFWEEFLSSKVLDDLVQSLFKRENIFKKKEIIDLFKERSYYFPNFNTSFLALSHKEIFYMYFPPTEVVCPNEALKDSDILDMINRAANKIKIHHEWGHTSSSYLFFTLKIKYFTTPERKIKYKETTESKNTLKPNKEGGKDVEMLLYGRVIEYLNAKEAIFILNNKNYNLSLNDFRNKFIALKNKKLDDVFQEALTNTEIDDYIKKAYEEYKTRDKIVKYNLQDFSFKIKAKKKAYINFENIKFELGNNYHPKHSDFIKKKK